MASFFCGAVSSSHCSGVFGSGIFAIANIVHREGRICRISYNLVVKRWVKQLLRYLVVTALDTLITWVCFHILNRNTTTVGFVLLLAILVVSATWGLRYAIFMAVFATLLYNFFFLPPLFTFPIADPQNWISLFAFFIPAIICTHLSRRPPRETRQPTPRREEGDGRH